MQASDEQLRQNKIGDGGRVTVINVLDTSAMENHLSDPDRARKMAEAITRRRYATGGLIADGIDTRPFIDKLVEEPTLLKVVKGRPVFARKREKRWGWLWRWSSCWIGCHYSKHHGRWCINVIPFLTLWIIRKGGDAP